MQSEKKNLIFRFNGTDIPKKISVDQNINKVIAIAKTLFGCADEEQCSLHLNGQGISEDTVLSSLNLDGGAILELVLNDLVTFQIFSDSKFFDCQGSLSRPIKEALEKFYSMNGLTSSSFELLLDGKSLEENKLLRDIPDVEDATIKLVRKAKDANQETLKGEEEKIEEKEVRFTFDENETYTFFIDWADKISSLKPAFSKMASLPDDTFQMWSAKGQELDDERSLSSQLSSENLEIQVRLLKYANLKISSEEKHFEKLIPIYPNSSIQELKMKFEKDIEISSSNQVWSLQGSSDGLPNDAKLEDYIQNPEKERLTIFIKDQSSRFKKQSKEKKVYLLHYEEKQFRRQFSIDEEIASLRQNMIKTLGLSDDTPLVLKFKGEVMALDKCLSDYMPGPTEIIKVEIPQDPKNLTQVWLIYQETVFELLVKKEASVQEIKEMACSEMKIQPSYFYSLLLDEKVLSSSMQLQKIPEFGEESVLELSSKMKVILVSGQKNQVDMSFDSSLKIEELKKQIQDKQIMGYRDEFYLKFGDIQIEESHSLNFYLKNEDPVVITICEKEKEEIKINLLFNKLAENKKYQVSVSRNESFQALTDMISHEFGISSSNQVWKFQGEYIVAQSVWENLIVKENGKEDLMIDVFECTTRPFNQKVKVTTHQYGVVNHETIEFNFLTPIAKLKQEVAQKLRLTDFWNQIWRAESEELQDNLPLASYENFIKKDSLHIYILIQREMTLFVEGKLLKVFLDLDAPIKALKETLFRENRIFINPEMQLWSLEDGSSQPFEDTKTLCFYFKDNHRSEIWVKKRMFLLKILLNDIEINIKRNFDVEIDPSSSVSAIKEKLKSILNIDPSKQYLTTGQTELKNQSSLSDYLSKDNNTFLNIEVLKLKEFVVFDEKNLLTLQAPLDTKIIDVKKKIQEHFQGIEVEGIQLESYNKRLENSHELKDYYALWINCDRPAIVMKKKARLQIHFLNRVENFYFDHETSVSILEEEMRERFSFGSHFLRLWDGKKEIIKTDLIDIVKNKSDKVLSCQKVKEIILTFGEYQVNQKEAMKFDSYTPLNILATIVSEKLKAPINECIIIHKGQPCVISNEVLLDHLDPVSSILEFNIQTIKVIEVQKQEQKFQINYLPSETIGNVKQKLISEGFGEIEKFSLFYNGASLKDEQTLESIGIKYGKHIFSALSKKKVLVTFKGEEYFETCGGSLKSVGDLKRHIKDTHRIDVGKQHFILMDNNQWQRVLSQENEILEEIQTDNLELITVVCKTMKKLSIRLGSQTKLETFEGLANGCLEEQKKLFEIIYKIPADRQVWMTGSSRNMKEVDEEEFLNNLADDYYNTNAIRIFRKIHLSVCLNGKSHTLLNVSTHETISNQKSKIKEILSILPQNQKWFYRGKQLEEMQSVEECLETMTEDNKASHYALDLIVQEDLDYFGFTERNEINKDIFHKFYIESDEELDLILKDIQFNKKEDSLLFRDKLLGLFFSTLKKHSLWENLIGKIKEKAYEKRNFNIWGSQESDDNPQAQFNTQFLLYYFLNSGTSELNIEILRIMKMHFPIPLVINTWSNRFTIESTKILEDLAWVMQKGFIVTSFGIGGAETQACGKSEFNNRVASCSFVQSAERNQICKGCPEIMFDIYRNDKFPINFIDIPSGTNDAIKQKIIASSNMLIIHSLADEETTQNYIKSQIHNTPTIVIYRDCTGAFANVSSFRENLMKSYAEALKTKIFEIKVNRKPNYAKSNELNDISGKINEFILHNFSSIGNEQEFWKFSELFGCRNQPIHAVFDKIRENSSQLVKAIPIFNDLKIVERGNLSESQKESETNKLMKVFQERSLAPEMIKILEILSASDYPSENQGAEKPAIILEKLQEYLRMMKSQQTMDFYKLYEYKANLSECKPEAERKILEDFLKYWEKVRKQDKHFEKQSPESNGKEQVYKFIEECIQIFEQKIIPNIFSIELFWRELIYFNSLKPGYQIKINRMIQNKPSELAINLNDFLVNLKRENLLNSYPFEIIDGDLLYMPKQFFKTVFTGMKDRVVVISVLGPQSSGKSTLLNFLFGCNFVTSSGRCTKGVYGTYFKVSNFHSCDGILVLDTEGLFGLLNKKEEQQRDRFDKKLVLFCLAMSDFVFINFKGDIDTTLTDVLMVCKDSLKRLRQGNVKVPEMFLVLNQNTQTDINTQLKDIDKMGDFGFARGNVEVLPLAFETFTNHSPAITKFMEPGTKKIAKSEFSEKCGKLSLKLFEKISKNMDIRKQRTLEKIIDRMEHLWELLGKYTDLLKHDTIIDQNQESDVKDWIQKEVDVVFMEKMTKTVESLKIGTKLKFDWEKDFSLKFNEEYDAIKKLFWNLFQNNTQGYLFKELENIFHAHLERIRIEKMNELKILSEQEKMKIYDAQGNETIREAAYKIKSLSNLTEKEKDKIFEETWKFIVTKLQDNFNKVRESERLFNTVVEHYRVNINKSTKALPKLSFSYSRHDSFEKFQEELKRKILRECIEEKSFESTSDPPALVFKGGKTNISGEYFNLKKYFTEKEVEETFGIQRAKLYKIFDFDRLREAVFRDLHARKIEETMIKQIIAQLQRELSLCGVMMPDSFLERTLKFKTSFWKWKYFSRDYVHPNEYGYSTCGYNELTNCFGALDFVDGEKICKAKIKYKEYGITWNCLFARILQKFINWEKINNRLRNELEASVQEFQGEDLTSKIKSELSKINLVLADPEPLFRLIYLGESPDIKNRINYSMYSVINALNYPSSSQSLVKYGQKIDDAVQPNEENWDLNYVKFEYLKKEAILELSQKIQNCDDQNFVTIQRFKGKKRVVLPEYSQVKWLGFYANEDSSKIFSNTIENKTLLQFVFKEFKFEKLIDKIFKICILNSEKNDNFDSAPLYQSIVRQITEYIDAANNDLQQTAYRLEYNLVGELHVAAVLLIWKLFEEKHWHRITKPVRDLEKRKDQQRNFFKSIASSDVKKVNEAEAEKVKQYIEDFIQKNVASQKKKEIINIFSSKFKIETRRKQIQEKLDSDYFSRNATANNDMLYYYILNQHEILMKTYDKRSKSFLDDIESQLQKANSELNQVLQDLWQKLTSVQVLLSTLQDESLDLDNMFEFKEYSLLEKNQVGMNEYNYQIGGYYYKIILNFLKGEPPIDGTEYNINSQAKVAVKVIESFKIATLPSKSIIEIMNYLETQSGRITNAKFFIDSLVELVQQLKGDSNKLFEFTEEDKKQFLDQINIFVCKQKCPCCDRICGEEDPNHSIHRCLYGHQIRAIGGTMLENNEASIARCEDIEDFDKMLFNGQEMTWAEFKDKMQNHSNIQWSFDDLEKTRKDEAIKEKFNFAWTLIGERVCSETYKNMNMKYVPFNQATIDNQKIKQADPINYIYMIDSSSSMSGDKWQDLHVALKETLGSINTLNEKNKITIVNFSSFAHLDYRDVPPNSVNLEVLRFQAGGTDFSAAFQLAFGQMKLISQNDIVLIFMTDGEDSYPAEEIAQIKQYVQSPDFKKLGIKFEFNALGFQCNSTILSDMAKELGGTTYFPHDRAQLTKSFIEILNKQQ